VGKKKNAKTGLWEPHYAVDFSVRFIEHALHRMGNMYIAKRYSYENAQMAQLLVNVMDIEINLTYSTERPLYKTVERSDPRGRKELSRRQNTEGQWVYLLPATEDEFRLKVGAEYSKMVRDEGKRVLDRTMLIEARRIIDTLMADMAARDPAAARKKIVDGFANVGVSPAQLTAYLEKPIESVSQSDLIELREVYTGLKEHSFTWEEAVRQKREPAEGEAPQPVAPSPGRPTLKDKIMAKHAATLAAEAKPEPQPEEEPQK
jgi:hypothetical protein